MNSANVRRVMPDRRRIDREESPPGAATEAAIADSVDGDGKDTHPENSARPAPHAPTRLDASLISLSIAAAGVVYGDIGTSPLYAVREAFHGRDAVPPTSADILGVLSLIVWALVLVVSVKYLIVIMRADNRGEGGILALLALLVAREAGHATRRVAVLIGVGLFGAALLYGDGVITPAISVLSAVEGLEVTSRGLQPFIIPITVAILVALFVLQRRGTASVGRLFGPIMIAWFVVLGVLGGHMVWRHPGVLRALSPLYAIEFFLAHGWRGVAVLGAVVLVITGAEALYADMGHFGRAPIRLAWFAVVLPCLLLNYLGQGALLLETPSSPQPFYGLAPARWSIALVVLATITTVIASQALISGAFSLTRQLMHLGYAPTVTVRHTSSDFEGQVYIPIVNWLLLVVAVLLVVEFGSSSRLASAYGLAVSATMALTTVLLYHITRWIWGWPRIVAVPMALLFGAIDVLFVVSNATKIASGGWVPLAIAFAVCALFTTWRRGRARLVAVRGRLAIPLDALVARVHQIEPCRTPGTGIFLSPEPDVAPGCLREFVERIRSLHEQVILVTIQAVPAPRVPAARRIELTRLPSGFVTVIARYGYMQSVALADVIEACEQAGIRAETPTYYLARERLHPTGSTRMARWRKKFFIFLYHNAPTMQDFFALPMQQVLELGLPIEL
jgi:KUP system potassium uptake protein